jgi:hypothetical protein
MGASEPKGYLKEFYFGPTESLIYMKIKLKFTTLQKKIVHQ